MAMDNQVVLTSFVYEMDAQVLVMELQAAGIDAMVRKDDCGGMRPAITNERGMEVLVDRADLERAQELLAVIEAEKVDAGPSKTGLRRRCTGAGALIAGIILGAAAMGLISWRKAESADYSGTEEADFNQDGRNDALFEYDKDGNLVRSLFDNNYDGEWDAWYFYEWRVIVSSRHDVDFNGKTDLWVTYKSGTSETAVYRPNGNAAFGRKQQYRSGIFQAEDVDTTGDGKYDTRIKYGPFENVISSNPILL